MKATRLTLCVAMIVCVAGVAGAQTEWVEHPDNPLIGPGESGEWDDGGHWLHEVVFDGSMYHMWFTGIEADGDFFDVGHATSADGVAWTMDPANPVLLHGDNGEWDDFDVGALGVVYDGAVFHMWYTGTTFDELRIARVGYATSPDGTVWTKSEHNPVMDLGPPGSWESIGVSSSTVILDGDLFRMWYVGASADGTFLARVGYAESSDGIVWNRRPEPVLDVGMHPGTFDRRIIAHPEVVVDGGLYHMWYAGGSGDGPYRIGYAYSTDGIHWTKHRGNPVLERPIYEVDGPNVLIEGSTFRMWFEDDDGSAYWINLATSDCCAGEPALDQWLFIPAAAVASGAQDSFYQTDVDLNNAGEQAVEYEFQWLPRGETNTEPITSEIFSLGAGMSVRYANVLSEVFGLEPNALGALKVQSSSPDLLAMSRTYNNPEGEDAGTFGQAMPAFSPREFIGPNEKRRILFASENDDLRFNVGCQSYSDRPTVINIELFDAEGTSLERTMMVLAAFGNDQLNRVFEDHAPVNGYVDVWTTTEDRSFYCYGSVLDNVTSDPTTVLPQ